MCCKIQCAQETLTIAALQLCRMFIIKQHNMMLGYKMCSLLIFPTLCCRPKRGNWRHFWCYCTGRHLPHGSHPNKVGSQSCWHLQRNCKCILKNCATRRLQGSLQVSPLAIHLFRFSLSLAASLHDLARSSNWFLCCILPTNNFQQHQNRHVCPCFKLNQFKVHQV